MGSPELDHQFANQDTRTRTNGTSQALLPGKQTLVEAELARAIPLPRLDVCPEYPPRQPSLLDDLLPRDKADLERRMAIATVRANELVIGALPLGGVFLGKREHYRIAIEVDRAEIGMRTLTAHTTMLGAIAGSILRLRGAPDVTIMQGAEAGAVIEGVIGALSRRGTSPGVTPPKRFTMTSEPPVKKEPTATAAAAKAPTAPAPAATGAAKSSSSNGGRSSSLISDLKWRSVRTNLDGTPNPRFDPKTPSHIANHFKQEQIRTQSNSPGKWRVPKGYQAQHPNGQLFSEVGEPVGTRLHWGTVEDNRDLQKPREMGQTPHKPPKPLP
jgi:hypothetical protein